MKAFLFLEKCASISVLYEFAKKGSPYHVVLSASRAANLENPALLRAFRRPSDHFRKSHGAFPNRALILSLHKQAGVTNVTPACYYELGEKNEKQN